MPTVHELKVMASRLADHLATKHGVKLKHSALLEAVAAQYGYRDWNTLLAVMASADNPVATPTPLPADPGYVLGHTPEGPVAVEPAALARHTLLLGAPGTGADLVAQHLLGQHIDRQGGFLFVDPKDDPVTREGVRRWMEKSGRSDDLFVIDLASSGASPLYNVLEHGEPDQMAQDLLALVPPESGLRPSWGQYAALRQLLVATLTLLRALGHPTSPPRLAALLALPEEMERLVQTANASTCPGPEVSEALSQLHSALHYQDQLEQPLFPATSRDLLNLLASRLSMLPDTATPASAQLPRLNLRRLLTQRQGLYLALPGLGSTEAQRAYTQLVLADLTRALLTTPSVHPDPGVPFLVFTPAVAAGPYLVPLLSQGRSAGVGLVVGLQDLSALPDSYKKQVLLANTATKLQCRSLSAAAASAELFGIPPEYLATLAEGEAVLLSADAPQGLLLRLAALGKDD